MVYNEKEVLAITSVGNWEKFKESGDDKFLNDIKESDLVSGMTVVYSGEGWEEVVTI